MEPFLTLKPLIERACPCYWLNKVTWNSIYILKPDYIKIFNQTNQPSQEMNFLNQI
jgi:hypothetical protein